MTPAIKELEYTEIERALQTVDIVLQHITRLDKAGNMEELDRILPDLLKSIGHYTRSDRAYLFDWATSEHKAFRMVHEWCADEVRPTIGEMQDVETCRMPNWMPLFEKGQPVVSRNWDEDGRKAASEFELFDGQDIHALIVLPIISNNRLNGYIGLDNPEHSIAQMSLRLLTSVGGHIGSLKENLHMMQELEEKQKELRKNLEKMEQTLDEARLNNEIISSISKIYWIIYRMDLVNGTYEEVSAGNEVHRLTGKHGRIHEVFQEVRENVVSEKYLCRMNEFMDPATLPQRLQDTETISTEYQTRNGSWHEARFIVKKRDAHGTVTNVLYAVREITDQKKQELEYQTRLMETAEEAKRANMAKTDFLRRMSHDIRTPINGIRGMLEIAEHFQDDTEKLKECREKIWDSSGYLLNLVNSVLDMNKLESGQLQVEEEPFNLLDVIIDLDNVIGTQAAEKGIQLRTKEHKMEHYHLIGCPLYIRQILMNIGANAVKYTSPGGLIEISCVEKTLDHDRTLFRLTVSDTGIGMSEEFQEHVFEAFAQEKTEMDSNGSGLGMTICKQLVDRMDGTISFESRQGKGTTFVVEFPCRIDPSVPVKEKKQEKRRKDLTGKKILLAEDNALNAEIAIFLLEQAGMIVTVAQNGQEAVELFQKSEPGHYDLILMDIMMPVMNGYEAAMQIRKLGHADAASIPIIAMSANAFPDDIAEAKRSGMNEHLAKPVDGNRMLEVIGNYIG